MVIKNIMQQKNKTERFINKGEHLILVDSKHPQDKMIKVDDIKKIVKLVLLSGYIKKHKPLSLLLVGDSGIGKTELITSYNSQRILFITDLSYMGLMKHLKDKPTLRHIIIPDFIKITKKKRATSDNLISILNALTEEGIGKISLYNFEADFKGKQLGIIIATTKASYEQHLKEWTAIGFVQRMLLCSYSYNHETTKEIIDYINSEEYLKEVKSEKLIKFKDTEVTSNKELNSQLNIIGYNKFRTIKHLQTLTKAHAILRGDNKVIQQDIDEIIRLSKYLNLNYTAI